MPCLVCASRAALPRGVFCQPCGRSYDRALVKDGTVYGAIEWAAARARRFERRAWARAIATRVR